MNFNTVTRHLKNAQPNNNGKNLEAVIGVCVCENLPLKYNTSSGKNTGSQIRIHRITTGELPIHSVTQFLHL